MGAIIRLKRCCTDSENAILLRAALTTAEYLTLQAIPAGETVGAGALAARVSLSPSRVSRVIERLVRRRLVSRADDPTDRRITRVSLTRTGRAVRREIDGCLESCDAELTRRLSARELAVATAGLAVLLRVMENR